MFIGTEFGLYFSYNKGVNWIKLKAGAPAISFRDIELHQRDGDLVGATFGRGFYVLDDYSFLRTISTAVTAKAERQDAEKALREQNAGIPFPDWENLRAESSEGAPQALLLARDENGDPVRWIEGANKKGLHRTSWDLKLPAPNPITLTEPAFKPPWVGDAEGPLAAPGKYMENAMYKYDRKERDIIVYPDGQSAIAVEQGFHSNNDQQNQGFETIYSRMHPELTLMQMEPGGAIFTA